MSEIVILIVVLLAAFIAVAWYAKRASQKRSQELDLDHLEPEINLDNDFNDYFERELQQQSAGDIDSEPTVSLSTAAETILSELEPIIESAPVDIVQSSEKTRQPQSSFDVVIDDDLEPDEEVVNYQAEPASLKPVPLMVQVQAEEVEEAKQIEQAPPAKPSPTSPKPKPPRKESDDLVIALTIVAPDKTRFSGKVIKAALESSNLQFGDLMIYHRFTAGSRKQSIFSVANILDPGTLLPDKFATLTTPGLLIFARLPGPVNGLALFDDLLETAQLLTEKLGGTLSDDRREPISESRLEAMRSRIFNLNFALHNENNDYSN